MEIGLIMGYPMSKMSKIEIEAWKYKCTAFIQLIPIFYTDKYQPITKKDIKRAKIWQDDLEATKDTKANRLEIAGHFGKNNLPMAVFNYGKLLEGNLKPIYIVDIDTWYDYLKDGEERDIEADKNFSRKNMSLPKYLTNAKYKGTLLRGSARFLDDKDKYEVGDILKNFKTSSASPPKTIEITKKELQEPGGFLPDQAFYYYTVVTRNNSMPNPPHLTRRSNSTIAENARKMAEKFHGRKVERVITVDEIEKDISDLAVIGELEQLEIFPIGSDTQIDLNFEDQLDNEKTVIEVCTDSEGKQIYLEKGNQNIDKGLSKIKSETSQTLAQRFIVLGHILAICYFTDKWHLEEENEPLWRVYSISKSGERTLEGEDLFEEDAIELQKELEGSGDEIQIGTPYRHEFGEDGGEMPFLIYDELNKKLSIVGGTYIVKDVGIWN